MEARVQCRLDDLLGDCNASAIQWGTHLCLGSCLCVKGRSHTFAKDGIIPASVIVVVQLEMQSNKEFSIPNAKCETK